MNTDDIVADLIALNDGKLFGRNRLQRQAYLLHRCGADFDIRFVYYRYGPHSFDLSNGVIEACADERIEIDKQRGPNGIHHAIFKSGKRAREPNNIGCLAADRAKHLIEEMEQVSDTVLELAATMVFLRDDRGWGENAVTETRARKPLKAQNGRLESALALVQQLGLDAAGVPPNPRNQGNAGVDTPQVMHGTRPDTGTRSRAAG